MKVADVVLSEINQIALDVACKSIINVLGYQESRGNLAYKPGDLTSGFEMTAAIAQKLLKEQILGNNKAVVQFCKENNLIEKITYVKE